MEGELRSRLQIKDKGGLQILNLDKFAVALQIRWIWLEWMEDMNPWFGLRNSCNAHDLTLFVGPTEVTIGDGRNVFFGCSWIDGSRRRNIDPLPQEKLHRLESHGKELPVFINQHPRGL
jgi:hypothetical protein